MLVRLQGAEKVVYRIYADSVLVPLDPDHNFAAEWTAHISSAILAFSACFAVSASASCARFDLACEWWAPGEGHQR